MTMSDDYRIEKKWKDLLRKHDRLRKQGEQQDAIHPRQWHSLGPLRIAPDQRRKAS